MRMRMRMSCLRWEAVEAVVVMMMMKMHYHRLAAVAAVGMMTRMSSHLHQSTRRWMWMP
jgi:hypothetical protein